MDLYYLKLCIMLPQIIIGKDSGLTVVLGFVIGFGCLVGVQLDIEKIL